MVFKVFIDIFVSMRKYALKTKDGEVIRKIAAHNYENALKLFCDLKKLSEGDLLTIYSIDEVS